MSGDKCYSCHQNPPVGGDAPDGNHCQDCNDKGYSSIACPDCYNREMVLFGISRKQLMIVGCPECGHRTKFKVTQYKGKGESNE